MSAPLVGWLVGWLQETWGILSIDALTVRLQSSASATVAIPFATEFAHLLVPPQQDRHASDLVWLARHLGQQVAELYMGSTAADAWATKGYALHFKMVTHKQETYDICGQTVFGSQMQAQTNLSISVFCNDAVQIFYVWGVV